MSKIIGMADYKGSVIQKGIEYTFGTAIESDIEKAAKTGEGSRGGHVIGHTRSGKAIYATAGHSEHASFNAHDHLDAYSTHMAYASKKINDFDTKGAKEHNKHAISHYRQTIEKVGGLDPANRLRDAQNFMTDHMDDSALHADRQAYPSSHHLAQMKKHQELGDKAKTTAERDTHYDFAHGHFKKYNDKKFLELMDSNKLNGAKRQHLLENHGRMKPAEIAKIQGEIDAHHNEFVNGMNDISNAKFSHPKDEKIKKIDGVNSKAHITPGLREEWDKMKDFIKEHDVKKSIDIAYAAGKITAEEFLKANIQLSNLIEKAGEGSRGGRVIGHTKSGQPCLEVKRGK